jgi:hypothetical protein
MVVKHLGANRILGNTGALGSSGWTLSTGNTISGGTLNSNNDSANQDRFSYYDLGAGNVADDWVLRFKVIFDTFINIGTNAGNAVSFGFGFTDVVPTNLTGETPSQGDWVTFSAHAHWNSATDFRMRTYSTAHDQTTGSSRAEPLTATRWCEITKDGTGCTLKVYTSDAFSGTPEETLTETLSTNITNLRYLFTKFYYQNIPDDNTVKIDDVNFYNNQTSATTLTTNWNFTDETDDKDTLVTTGKESWTEMDSSKIAVNTSTGKIDFEMVDGSIDNVYYPITVEDDAWQLRAIVNFTSGASANSNTGNQYFRFGLATLGTGGGSSEPTEGILTTFQDHGGASANEKWHLKGTGGSTVYTGTNTGTTTGVDYYLTLKRTSTTAISVDLKTVSHSGSSLTGFPLTTGVASGTDGLAYLFIANGHNQGSDIRALSGTIRAIQVWTDSAGTGDPDFEPTLLAGSDLEENTIFIETDTYTHHWLQSNKWYPLPVRGVFEYQDELEYINVAVASNATVFGATNIANTDGSATGGNATYGACCGISSTNTDISRWSFATLGTGVNWGDLNTARKDTTGCSNETRFVIGGGYISGAYSGCDSVTIDSSGTASSFGTIYTNYGGASFSSATRAVFGGGYNGSYNGLATQHYMTFASGGTASSSGSLIGTDRWLSAGASNSTHGIYGGGYNGATTMQKMTIASLGTGTSFGNLSVGRHNLGALSSDSRAIWGAGGGSNVMDFKTFDNDGTCTDFGDLSFSGTCSGISDLVRT